MYEGECRVGDVVFLKSGSPSLIVTRIWKGSNEGGRSGTYVCVEWLNYLNTPQETNFPIECVRNTPPETK